MYDIARGAYLKPHVFKDALRLAAASGFTHLVAYLENMVRLPSMAKACPKNAYSPQQWREFDDTARECGIELAPNFNVIGHTDDVCKAYPELAGGGGGGALDPTTPAAQDWTLRCLQEWCEISAARHILIGGDEWQAPGHLLRRDGFDAGRAWVDQINLAVEFLAARDRVPIVWHDMLLHYPETLDRLSRDAAVAFWFYDEDSDYPALDLFKSLGFRTIMASGMTGDSSLTHRRLRALRCAVRAMEHHHADGFLMTSWEDCRWEIETLGIPLVGRALLTGVIPDAIVDATTLYDTLQRLGAEHPAAGPLAAEIRDLLRDGAWDEFPECRARLTARLDNDVEEEERMFLENQAAEGRLLARIRGGEAPPSLPTPIVSTPAPAQPDSFGVTVAEDEETGAAIRVVNGGETFVVYPRYGATLQDWRTGAHTIIPHALPHFLRGPVPLPGGYRSHSGCGGLRPSWCLGTNHNPCILWQVPWQWRIVTADEEAIVLALERSFSHVDLSYEVSVRRGVPGFRYDVTAVNRLPSVWAAFAWNLPLDFSPADYDDLTLTVGRGAEREVVRLSERRESGFFLEATDLCEVRTRDWRFSASLDPAHTAGVFVDWAATFLTPDLRGRYRRLTAGEQVRAGWRFAAHAEPAEQDAQV